LESNLKWLLGSDTHDEYAYWLVSSDTLREYVAGGSIGEKQNNIQEALFRNEPKLTKDILVAQLENWLNGT